MLRWYRMFIGLLPRRKPTQPACKRPGNFQVPSLITLADAALFTRTARGRTWNHLLAPSYTKIRVAALVTPRTQPMRALAGGLRAHADAFVGPTRTIARRSRLWPRYPRSGLVNSPRSRNRRLKALYSKLKTTERRPTRPMSEISTERWLKVSFMQAARAEGRPSPYHLQPGACIHREDRCAENSRFMSSRPTAVVLE